MRRVVVRAEVGRGRRGSKEAQARGTADAPNRRFYRASLALAERKKREPELPTFILLSTLSPHGAGTLKANPERLREVNTEIEQMGAKVLQQYACLGPYDFVNIVDAPDEKVIARVSVELASRGTAHFQTLPAIPVDEFISLLED